MKSVSARQARLRQLLRFDQRLQRRHHLNEGELAGLDEAGRGPLAGPLVASAVILRKIPLAVSIDDSKRLTPLARETAFFALLTHADIGVGYSVPEEIDRFGIQAATGLAMRRALECLPERPAMVLIDGAWIPKDFPARAHPIVRGDSRSLRIASASIVAKVIRDRMMMRLHQILPAYRFDRHKGYGTRGHMAALSSIGASSFHRFSFRPVRSAGGGWRVNGE